MLSRKRPFPIPQAILKFGFLQGAANPFVHFTEHFSLQDCNSAFSSGTTTSVETFPQKAFRKQPLKKSPQNCGLSRLPCQISEAGQSQSFQTPTSGTHCSGNCQTDHLGLNRRPVVSFIQYDILETLQEKLIHPSGYSTSICLNPPCFPSQTPPLPALPACQTPAALMPPSLHRTPLLLQVALGAGATPKQCLAPAAVS